MPAPRAPKLTGQPSAKELQRAAQLIRRANNLTAAPPLRLVQGPTGQHLQLDGSTNWFLARLTVAYTLTNEDVGPFGAYPGMAAGTVLYGFIEQIFDPATGLPADLPSGRQTVLDAVTQKPASSYAIEDSNQSLAVPTATPTGFAKPGPYVEMRFKGLVGAAPVFQFSVAAPPLALVKVTESGPSKIYIGREVADGALNGTDILVSASAGFTSGDLGSQLVGDGIPDGTTIESIVDGETVQMSNSASTIAGNVTVIIGADTILGFAATIQNWITTPPPPLSTIGDWTFQGNGQPAWLISGNSPDPSSPGTVPPHDQFPLANTGYPFLCYGVKNDAAGIPIFLWPYDPAAFYDTLPTLFQQQLSQAPGMVQYGFPGAPGRMSMGYGFLLFGAPNDQGEAFGPIIYVAPPAGQIAPQAYEGDSGMDGDGNQFVSGLNVGIGGGSTFISGGSDW